MCYPSSSLLNHIKNQSSFSLPYLFSFIMCSHKNEYSSSYYRHKSRKPIVFIVIKTGQQERVSQTIMTNYLHYE